MSVDESHASTVAAITSAGSVPSENQSSSTTLQPPAASEPLPRSIEDFDKLVQEDVRSFVAASSKVGDLVEQQAKSVLAAFDAERTYLLLTTKAKKPNPQPPELLTELHHHTGAVDDIREANRPSPLFPHLSAISEGIVALGWIVETRPADFVTDTLGSAQFFGNRVLKEYKDKDKAHTEFIQAYYRIFKSLITYIKQHYPSGLTWNNKDGIDAMEALNQIKSGSSPSVKTGTSSAPPPPPPLPTFDAPGAPPPPPMPAAGGGSKSGGDMSAVFDQLNRGSSVTSGLRKVEKSEMTHKNPSLRASSTVPERSNSQTSISSSTSRGKSPMPSKKPKPESMRTKKPPKKELEGNKWLIENFENVADIIEIPAQLTHSILITRCSKCIIKINGKANAVSIDNCASLSIVVDSLVSSLDVIKSPKFQLQIDGQVPTVMLDQVDTASLYLSQESVGTEVFTSKSSSINIVLPPKNDNEDDKECPLPEQIRSVVKGGTVVSEIVEHAG
ncbi:MAG: hypothetical protein Q9227_001555 [Pyrenula ochraceoflavens]